MKHRSSLILKLLFTAAALAVMLYGLFWPRFPGLEVWDREFDPDHTVVEYQDDELPEGEDIVRYSWSHRDVNEFLLIDAASKEAIETRERTEAGIDGALIEIFVTNKEEFCFS